MSDQYTNLKDSQNLLEARLNLMAQQDQNKEEEEKKSDEQETKFVIEQSNDSNSP